jgi:ElaB/YqjD/DUF883 family membrane-anchored ribosome-binding protein
MSPEVDTDIRQLRAELVQLRKDLGTLTTTLEKTAQDGTAEAKERIHRTVDSLRAEASGAAERVSHEIEENPITGALAAFGVGIMIGLLLGPRR